MISVLPSLLVVVVSVFPCFCCAGFRVLCLLGGIAFFLCSEVSVEVDADGLSEELTFCLVFVCLAACFASFL